MCQFEQIPSWLLNPAQKISETKKNRLNFLRQTITHLGNVFKNEIYLAEQSKLTGFLQKIDPRAKLMCLLALIIFTNFTHNWLVFALLFFINISYVYLSHLQLTTFLKRVWGYIPLVILIFSLPGILNSLTPGTALITLLPVNSPYFTHGLSITTTGIKLVAKLVVRSGINLGFAYLLIVTTPWSAISQALNKLKFLRGFIVIIDMCYRYLFLLATQAIQMTEARFMRSIGYISHQENRRYLGHSMALLFIKSSYLSEEIYAAMRLRGFRNKFVSLHKFAFSLNDVVFIINNFIIITVLLFLNRI